jgi:molybdopterin-guanine dinucleotide biosynthesis protein A
VSDAHEHEPAVSSEVTIAVIAGGMSQRMGRDKAAILIGGVAMLERITSEALRTGCPVVVVGRSQTEVWNSPEVKFVPDETPGLGPLGGLATALRSIGTPILALACDMPLLTRDAIHWLLDVAGKECWEDGLITTIQSEPEPLFSVYHPTCLPLIEQRLAEGRRSVKGLIEGGRFMRIEAPVWVAAQLRNVNTPEDVEGLSL